MGVLDNRLITASTTLLVLVCIVTQLTSTVADEQPILNLATTNYTTWNTTNINYGSSTAYNAKGMGPLYKIANQVLNIFVGDEILPEGK